MSWMLGVLVVWMLARTDVAMSAASDACRLFVTCVMPGLLPYMVVSQLLISRIRRPLPPSLIILLGWGGGSPTGAMLLHSAGDSPLRVRRRIAVTCATMSPMFLLGTLGQWLNSQTASLCILLAVLLGGYVAGRLCGRISGGRIPVSVKPLSFGQAVESTARTLLIVCGTMAVLRMAAALVADILPHHAAVILPVTTLMEVTAGAQQIAALPLPLQLRTALLAAATGFGGVSIILQNQTLLPENTLPLASQLLWQILHAAVSFLLAYGFALLLL